MAFLVVAARFCARRPTAFTVAKTGWPWRRDLTVTDDSGAAVMRVEGPFFSLYRRSLLLDAASRPVLTVAKTGWPWRRDLTVTDDSGAAVMRVEGAFFSLYRRSLLLDAASCPVLTVERRPSLFEVRRTWEAFKGDITSSKDLLFSAVVEPSLTNTGDIDVRLAGEGYGDFVGVRPWYCSTDCTVTRGGAAVAHIESSGGFFWPTKYDVRVNVGLDHAFILGLTVVLEEIRLDDADQERSRALERSRARNNKTYKY